MTERDDERVLAANQYLISQDTTVMLVPICDGHVVQPIHFRDQGQACFEAPWSSCSAQLGEPDGHNLTRLERVLLLARH